MRGYVNNIERLSLSNQNFRQVLYTTPHSQLVLMSLPMGEQIGEEVHEVDQFIRVERGVGQALLNGLAYELSDGSAVVVPAGVKHNILNTGNGELKLYTIYTPPHHRDGVIHKLKADAEADHEEFDGKISE